MYPERQPDQRPRAFFQVILFGIKLGLVIAVHGHHPFTEFLYKFGRQRLIEEQPEMPAAATLLQVRWSLFNGQQPRCAKQPIHTLLIIRIQNSKASLALGIEKVSPQCDIPRKMADKQFLVQRFVNANIPAVLKLAGKHIPALDELLPQQTGILIGKFCFLSH